MPKKRVALPELNESIYQEKMLRLRAALLAPFVGPEMAGRIAQQVVDDMTSSWKEGFSRVRTPYFKVAVPILDREGIKGGLRATYRAFVNEVASKVFTKGTETIDQVIAKFVAMHCDEAILREIVEGMQKLFA
ncbi:MAG: hypothetical protein B6U97_03455 [Candidatus Altiarchaeales archaeon ex4484_96]|nr:MAG: hypothetical protein B6U97_03455 [Candidatus Altiarchaeales archaeon ex4484_96]